MSDKIVFIAFAKEDEHQRDLLKGQSFHSRAPYDFRIKRSAGIIALVSKNSQTSSGQKWEIKCSKEEGKPIRGIWAYSDDRTEFEGVSTRVWSDKNISDFIDSL